MRPVASSKGPVDTGPFKSEETPKSKTVAFSPESDSFEQVSTPQMMRRSSSINITRQRLKAPPQQRVSNEDAVLEKRCGALDALFAESNTALEMIKLKGARWNDAETRMQLVRANACDKLVEAMDQIPRRERAKARKELAQSAAAYFAENNGFKNSVDNAFFLAHIATFYTLFASDGLLKLPFPRAYKKEIKAVMNGMYRQSMDHFEKTGFLK